MPSATLQHPQQASCPHQASAPGSHPCATDHRPAAPRRQAATQTPSAVDGRAHRRPWQLNPALSSSLNRAGLLEIPAGRAREEVRLRAPAGSRAAAGRPLQAWGRGRQQAHAASSERQEGCTRRRRRTRRSPSRRRRRHWALADPPFRLPRAPANQRRPEQTPSRHDGALVVGACGGGGIDWHDPGVVGEWRSPRQPRPCRRCGHGALGWQGVLGAATMSLLRAQRLGMAECQWRRAHGSHACPAAAAAADKGVLGVARNAAARCVPDNATTPLHLAAAGFLQLQPAGCHAHNRVLRRQC